MKIVDIRHASIPIASPMRNAYINFDTMTASIAALVTDMTIGGEPVIGYGFTSNGRYAQTGLMTDRFIPRILAASGGDLLNASRDNLEPSKIWDVMMRNEKPGGHGERSAAVGCLDMAIWDAVSKISGRSLGAELSERYGDGTPMDDSVFVYAAGGYYYPSHDNADLTREMESYLQAGFRNVKLKIGGASLSSDIQRIEAVIDVVGDAGRVAVDANGRFDLQTALDYGRELQGFGLAWYEEPGDPLDFELMAAVARAYPGPLATGENLFSMVDARNLARYAGMRSEIDLLQMDPVLSYGIVEYVETLEVLRAYGWSSRRLIPHGGHQMVLHVSAALHLGGNELYPGLFEPFGQLANGMDVVEGRVKLSDLPGIGYEGNPRLMDLFGQLVR